MAAGVIDRVTPKARPHQVRVAEFAAYLASDKVTYRRPGLVSAQTFFSEAAFSEAADRFATRPGTQ